MDKGIRLTLAPKLISALSKVLSPMVHGMVSEPRTFFFIGIFIPCKTTFHFLVRSIGSVSVVHFLEIISFTNLAYIGICSRSYEKRTLISRFLNISKNLSKFFSCRSFFLTLWGYGSLITTFGSFCLSVSTTFRLVIFSGSSLLYLTSRSTSIKWSSSSIFYSLLLVVFPLLVTRTLTLLCLLGFLTIALWRVPWACREGCCTIRLTWSSKFLIDFIPLVASCFFLELGIKSNNLFKSYFPICFIWSLLLLKLLVMLIRLLILILC